MVSFSRKLKATDVGSHFSWPSGKLHLLPPFGAGRHQVRFEAVDATGRSWPFTCSVRTRGPYLKPVLTRSGWIPFVREKGLVVGDLVTFYSDPEAGHGFRIRVRKLKTIRLMGHYITAYAQEE